MIKIKYFKLSLAFLSFLLFFSCAEKEGHVKFSLGFDLDRKLFASGKQAQEGTLDCAKPKRLEYRFDDSVEVPPNSSFVIEYDFSVPLSTEMQEIFSLVLDMGDDSWDLPFGIHGFQYAVPIRETFSGGFSITLSAQDKINKSLFENSGAPVFRIRSMRLEDRWFGFETYEDEYYISTPFVKRRDAKSYVIDVPKTFFPQNSVFEILAYSPLENAVLEFESYKIEAFPGSETFFIPQSMYKGGSEIVLHTNLAGVFALFTLPEKTILPIPLNADPAIVIAFPKENWRKKTYEVFRWDNFKSLLIFDFADYAAQDRMLKRLAFFVEKTGFRGRLAPDSEIAELHGWNAHDYRAEDLAHFFDAARRTDFPLLEEERQLKEILFYEEIIKISVEGYVSAGRGGIISISRESADYLRFRFMAHEGFHGLFFIDEDFRAFSRRRWENLSPVAKRALISFFEFQQYDVKDEYLLINEFMAHVLQQPVSAAAEYFGKNLPQRLESSWRAAHLPKKDAASGTWPALASAFTTEAEAFSAYVKQRWGLSAGRVWNLRVN